MSDLASRLADRAGAAGIPLDDTQLGALAGYLELLARWNTTINLTSLPLEGFPDTTLDRLIGEPLVASRFVRLGLGGGSGVRRAVSLFDLGSGGGSPAIPLKIVHPDVRLTMVESKERKSAFLREAVRVLGLGDSGVLTARLEDLTSTNVDTITVRAVSGNKVLAAAVRRMLSIDGRLLMFGTDQPQLSGLEVETEAALPAAGDRLFVMKRDSPWFHVEH